VRIREYRNIVLVGSTSEIGSAILDELKLSPEANIYYVGRGKPESQNFLKRKGHSKFIYCELVDTSSVKQTIDKLVQINEIDLLILAGGYLPAENSEFDSKSIIHSLTINAMSPALFLVAVAEKMMISGKGDILVISSVASLRPRIRNFTYGSSKAALDFFSTGLANKLFKAGVFVCILRPGFVYTKMTTDFKPAPFATTPRQVGIIAAHGLNQRKKVIYAPKKIKYVMKVIEILPKFVFKLIE
jgi:short-subunit dehydrogenase